MKNKQTAVEWLVNNIWKGEPTLHQKVLIEQAKQMEKKQIIDAFYNGTDNRYDGEQYYNETYGEE